MSNQDAVSLSNTPRRGFIRSSFADHAGVLTVSLLAIGAAIGAAIVLGGSSSDEAPIRVKNGSMDIELLSTSQAWADDGSAWHIDGGHRYREEFEVTVAARSDAQCSPSKVASGANVELTFNDNRVIRFQSAGQKTKITPNSVIQQTGSRQLRYGPVGGGFIRQIAVRGNGAPTVLCTFQGPEQLDHILILNVPQ
jgi:hypothetical protein